jgi:hypothetical protein
MMRAKVNASSTGARSRWSTSAGVVSTTGMAFW